MNYEIIYGNSVVYGQNLQIVALITPGDDHCHLPISNYERMALKNITQLLVSTSRQKVSNASIQHWSTTVEKRDSMWVSYKDQTNSFHTLHENKKRKKKVA